MGGHGGLNILPQKRWNVYNFDNRERVRRDEEAAAREEQVRQQRARQVELEFKLDKLRQASQSKRRCIEQGENSTLENGPVNAIVVREASGSNERNHEIDDVAERSQHINLFAEFEGREGQEGNGRERQKRRKGEDRERIGRDGSRNDRREGKGIEKVDGKPTGEPADENYSLGHGAVDKNGRKPWYLLKSFMLDRAVDEEKQRANSKLQITDGLVRTAKLKKKGIEELRAERMRREQEEKAKLRNLAVAPADRSATGYDQRSRGRAPHYHGSFGNAR